MKVFNAVLFLAGLLAVAGEDSIRVDDAALVGEDDLIDHEIQAHRELHHGGRKFRHRGQGFGRRGRRWRIAGDCGTIQLVLGDDKDDTEDCAEDVENAIKAAFFVSVDKDIDPSATSDDYSIDDDDEATIYIDVDVVDDDCEEVVEDAIEEVDDALPGDCETAARMVRTGRGRRRRGWGPGWDRGWGNGHRHGRGWGHGRRRGRGRHGRRRGYKDPKRGRFDPKDSDE